MAAPPVAPEDKELLKQLAKFGGLHDHVLVSSSELAQRLGVSQQTASRKILQLLDAGLILRRMGTRKQHIRVSPAGIDILRREYADYRQLFQGGERITLRGKVVTGLGEGRYYISREGYRKAFSTLLGFDPYAGTLNIEVDAAEREKMAQLKEMEGLMIEPFQSEGRTFGGVKCFRASVRVADAAHGAHAPAAHAHAPRAHAAHAHAADAAGRERRDIEAAAIFPLRSHHVNVLELISPHGLREELSLADGTEVVVTLNVSGALSSPTGVQSENL